MVNKILLTFVALDSLFVLGGGLLIGVALITNASLKAGHTSSNVATDLLLSDTPLTASITNAIFIFATFLLSIPALASPTHRLFLRLHGYAVVFCGIFTMILGLSIWFETLKTRSNLSVLWGQQTPQVQSLLQQKFHCCGYMNATSPPFIVDSTCTNPLVAANLQGCVGPFSSFANMYLDVVFTAVFGLVAIDAMLVLCIACLLKDRKEKERFRLIDAKVGFGPI